MFKSCIGDKEMLKKVLKKFVSFALIFTIFTLPCMHVFADNSTEIISINGNEFEVTEENDKITVVQTLDDQVTKAVYNKSTHSLVINSFYEGRLCFVGKADLSSSPIENKEALIDFLMSEDLISHLDYWDFFL